jgi:DNA mismatch repair protein MSH3
MYCLQCTPNELALLLKAFGNIANAFDEFSSPDAVGFKSSLINDIFYALPLLKGAICSILPSINLRKAEKNMKSELWLDPDKFSSVEDRKMVRVIMY